MVVYRAAALVEAGPIKVLPFREAIIVEDYLLSILLPICLEVLVQVSLKLRVLLVHPLTKLSIENTINDLIVYN